eukprot:403336597
MQGLGNRFVVLAQFLSIISLSHLVHTFEAYESHSQGFLQIADFKEEIKQNMRNDQLKKNFLKSEKSLLTVGILTLPSTQDDMKTINSGQYVLEMAEIWMLSAGLNPVAIPYNSTDDDLMTLLLQVNGIYFTGGDLDLYDPVTGQPHAYTVTSQKILNYAKQQKQYGAYFPIIGVCQGHELLHMLIANDPQALGWSDLENQNVNTDFLINPKSDSRLFSQFDDSLITALKTQNLMMHLHHRGIPASDYEKYPELKSFFKIISTNTIGNQTIVSTAEAYDFPIYIMQYHPESVLDPVSDLLSNRSRINFLVAQSFSNFFASECDQNDNQFQDRNTLEKTFVRNGSRGQVAFINKLVNAFGIDY